MERLCTLNGGLKKTNLRSAEVCERMRPLGRPALTVRTLKVYYG